MPTVFVTGGTGFLGAYIIKELIEKKYSVRAIRRSHRLPLFIPGAIFEQVEWISGDIFDVVALEAAMAGADAVIHAAAKVSYTGRERDEIFKTNIEGTANVVNAALEKKVGKFVQVSSVSAFGRNEDGDRVDENKKWMDSKLNTHYGISKYRGEMEVWRGVAEGLQAVIVNPAVIIGYGNWNNSSCALFKSVYDELPWYTCGVNGFVDVEDTASVIVKLMESEISSERFIVSGETTSFQDICNRIADAFGKKRPTRKATAFLGGLAWRLEKIKSLFTAKASILTKESTMLAMTKTYYENRKILSALPGFSFTPLEQTIQKACEKYKTDASSNVA